MLRQFAAAVAMVVVSCAADRICAENISPDQQAAKQKRLDEKLAEMSRLHGEIDQLRAEIGTSPQILVKVQAFEISRTKMRELGID